MNYTPELAALVASGRATLEDMNTLGAENVAAIKRSCDVLQLRPKAHEPVSVNEEKRTISYVVSDETVDRMGDIIQVKGWDLASYKKNPVILWSHDGGAPPIGRATNVRRRYGPARLTADIEFAPKEAHEFADTIYQLAARGFIKATSVGFMPTGTGDVDEKSREKLGLGPYGQLYTGAELMEISIVSVPANPSALQEGVKSMVQEGKLNDRQVTRFLDTYPASESVALEKVRAACRSFIDFGAKAAPPVAANHLADSLAEPSEEFCAKVAPEEVAESDPVAPEACEPAVEEKEHHDVAFLEAMTGMIEQQAEQTRATRQLVDALSDLTRRLHVQPAGGTDGGSDDEPDARVPDASEDDGDEMGQVIESAFQGFVERVRRDLLSNNPKRND